jgi:hypothetical protein
VEWFGEPHIFRTLSFLPLQIPPNPTPQQSLSCFSLRLDRSRLCRLVLNFAINGENRGFGFESVCFGGKRRLFAVVEPLIAIDRH